MTDELVLYTNPMSRGRIARWMVEEIGQPYRAEIVGFGAPMKSADYKAINPMGKVPTLVHGDTVVTECAAICAYLADAFPQAGLAPEADSRLRGPYYRWLFFAAGPIEAAVSNKAFGFEVPPERARSMGYGTFGDVMDTLEQAVSQGEYLLGDRFSAADVYGKPVGLPVLVDQVVDLYQHVAEEKGIDLHPVIPAGLEVHGDRGRLQRALGNLVDNAIKYTPEQGRVEIRAKRVDSKIQIEVADNGAGIPIEDQTRIWERLYRVDKSRSQRGLGLGLSFVKAIVEAHGGKVNVESEQGRGARFIMQLPN